MKKETLKNGNAVVAVKDVAGTVMWSWHLWFAPQSALATISVTNKTNYAYNFTTENLGWKYTSWNSTTFTSPRSVKVRVEQEVGNGLPRVFQSAVVTITQKDGYSREGINTFYQFGRKDAFPGTNTVAQGSFEQNSGNNISIVNAIQHPDKFYVWGDNWETPSTANPNACGYYNLWSALNTTGDFNDKKVVKTVYDPCPVGFKMPASNAFSGFTTTGWFTATISNINALDKDRTTFYSDYGYHFYTNSLKNTTIFFPVSGRRNYLDGSLREEGVYGYYWLAIPYYRGTGAHLGFGWRSVSPRRSDGSNGSYGYGIRPSSDK